VNRATATLCLFLFAGASVARAEEPPAGAVPFPVGRTCKLTARNGPVYYIDGPTVIPPKVEITVQLDVQIVGINGATLDVQGGLKVHGTQDHWVKIENVDLSPTQACRKGLHLDMVDLRGFRLVHGEGAGFTGELTIENAAMQRDCAFDVCLHTGTLKLMTIESGIPWTIRCASPDPKTKPILVQVRSCWARATQLSGACDATLRHSEIKGGLTCRNVTEVVVDGCDLTDTLAFHQGPEDVFKQITLSKCNLFDGCTLVLDREANEEAKQEKVKVDKFYFGKRDGPGGITKSDAVQTLIHDDADEPHRRVTARVAAPQKKKHLLVNYDQLRLRVPPVR
jgi:hypothetical protein